MPALYHLDVANQLPNGTRILAIGRRAWDQQKWLSEVRDMVVAKTKDDFDDAIDNSPYSFDITPAHIQISTDLMVKYGIGKMDKPPVATDWVKTDLLDGAKKSLGVK